MKSFIDLWYNDNISDIDKIDIFFYSNNGEYHGNMYIKGNAVGDYCATSKEVKQ